jgi:putative acetyltransferase
LLRDAFSFPPDFREHGLKGGQSDRLFAFSQQFGSYRDTPSMQIRLAQKTDQPQIVRLIAEILREYGDLICLDNCDSDLLDLQKNFTAIDGAFWVLEEAGKIMGTVAVTPSEDFLNDEVSTCLLKRLYLHRSLRGGTWGRELMQTAVAWAKREGFKRLEFWSDTRFSRAHNFYQKFGCQMTGNVRTIHDTYTPFDEYQFRLELVPSG